MSCQCPLSSTLPARKSLISLETGSKSQTTKRVDQVCGCGYLSAPVCDWTAQEIDFVDWVFNSSAVLRERAILMEQHEGLTYERDAVRREPFALRSSYFVNELTDDLSIAMVKKIQIRRVNNPIWTIIYSQMDES